MATVNLSNELQEKINDVKKSQARIERNLKKSKEGIDKALIDGIKNVMSNEDFINNEDYLEYYKSKYSGTTHSPDDEAIQTEWTKLLKKDEQINLLAEYGIDAEREQGHNVWEKGLLDAQKAKEVTKKAVAIQAKSVIESYKQLMVSHENTIVELKADIKTAEKDIQAKTKELAEIQSKMKKRREG